MLEKARVALRALADAEEIAVALGKWRALLFPFGENRIVRKWTSTALGACSDAKEVARSGSGHTETGVEVSAVEGVREEAFLDLVVVVSCTIMHHAELEFAVRSSQCVHVCVFAHTRA